MPNTAVCHACATRIPARLRHHRESAGAPAGCCVQCQSFACTLHGERESSTQQFRCLECLPAFLLHSAIRHCGSENELAKIILDRSSGPPRAWRTGNAEAFLALHDLVSDRTSESLSEFYQHSDLDLGLPELNCSRQWEPALRDLRRIQFRLDATPQRDLLKLAAAFLAFLYPPDGEEAGTGLPPDMEVLRSALVPAASESRRSRSAQVAVHQG